jgi:hypothetical protein
MKLKGQPRLERRRRLFQERATVEGEAWAAQTRANLSGEHRAAAGGWPGTLSEARERVALLLVPWSSCEGLGTPTSDEREEAARTLYARARSVWLKNCERETDPSPRESDAE